MRNFRNEVLDDGAVAMGLASAARSGDAAALKRLLGQGSDPNLCLAMDEASVGELVAARVQGRPERGMRALNSAALNDRLDCLRALLAAGADPMALGADGAPALFSAVCSGSARCAAELIPLTDPAATDKHGQTARELAVRLAGAPGAGRAARDMLSLFDAAALARSQKSSLESSVRQAPPAKGGKGRPRA